jgi:hypothetical protein
MSNSESGLVRSDGVLFLDLLVFLGATLFPQLSSRLPGGLCSFRSCASIASANNWALGLGLRLDCPDLLPPSSPVAVLLGLDGDLWGGSSSDESASSEPETLLASKSDPSSSQKSSMNVSSCIESASEVDPSSALLTTGLGLVILSSVRRGLAVSPSSSKMVHEGALSILGRSKVWSDSAPSLRLLTVPLLETSSGCDAGWPKSLLCPCELLFLPRSCSSEKSSSSESNTMRLALAMAVN